jgi:hypothetical protein
MEMRILIENLFGENLLRIRDHDFNEGKYFEDENFNLKVFPRIGIKKSRNAKFSLFSQFR